MNALQAENEQKGIRDVIRTIDRLPKEAQQRIRAVHLHCSTPGKWQAQNHPPELPGNLAGESPDPGGKSPAYR